MSYVDSGMGRIGDLKEPIALETLCGQIKGHLGLDRIRYIGDDDVKVKRLAICSGSGSSLLHEAIKRGAQALLTGDVRYHQAREAQAHGIAIIDAGHFSTEVIILPFLMEAIKRGCEGKGSVEISIASNEKDPFKEI